MQVLRPIHRSIRRSRTRGSARVRSGVLAFICASLWAASPALALPTSGLAPEFAEPAADDAARAGREAVARTGNAPSGGAAWGTLAPSTRSPAAPRTATAQQALETTAAGALSGSRAGFDAAGAVLQRPAGFSVSLLLGDPAFEADSERRLVERVRLMDMELLLFAPAALVPEPGTGLLVGLGIALLGARTQTHWRGRRNSE